MKRALWLAAILGVACVGLVDIADADAGGRHSRGDSLSEHPKAGYYHSRRGGPRVRGYVARRGGYSYSYSDTINTYGNPRTQYGGTNLYRDPMLDRQTNGGPFDHGFFFDSATTPRGGEAPYMQ